MENKLEIIEELINEDQIQPTTSKKTNNKTNRNQKSLMKHQEEVLASWEDNDRFGLVIHATGSGKTITGINAIKDWLEQGNVALVVVPSVVLLEQWIQRLIPK